MPAAVLYYVRHGETDWNVEGRLQGRRDIPLNATGRKQAIACAAILHDLVERDAGDLTRYECQSSPLSRARETMELMRTALALDPHAYRIDPRLTEISFGAWEGLTLREVRGGEPAALAARERDKWRFVPPGGESYEQLSARMRDWHASLAGDSVVVAHGGTARALMVVLGIASAKAAPAIPIDQGVVYRFGDGGMACYR
jgi:broad specificity phosphatase PhoE